MAERYETERRQRRGIDPFALIAGLGTLLASAYVLTDGTIWLPSVDPRWLIAGSAILIGLIFLVNSLRGGRR